MARTTRSRTRAEDGDEAMIDAAPVDQPAEDTTPVPPSADPQPESVPEPEVATTAVAESPSVTPTERPTQSAPARALLAAAALGGVTGASVAALAILWWMPAAPDSSAALRTFGARLDAIEARGEPDLSPLQNRLTALETAPAPVDPGPRLDALESRAIPDLSPLAARISALESAPRTGDTSALETRLTALETRLGAEARAVVEAAFADARTEAQRSAEALARQQADLAAQQARIDTRAALATLTAAAESGAAAAPALALLADPPAGLAPFADGLVTLDALRVAFAPAARAALAAAPPPADASGLDRVLGFLRAQTGARSLAPRDGDDADAVLSRAEAALRRGDLVATLSELDALAPAPAETLADWRSSAEIRLAALAALDDMRARLAATGD